jgi:hypothetical protein
MAGKRAPNLILRLLSESFLSIAPLIGVVLILSWSGLAPLSLNGSLLLLASGLFLIIGLTVFSLGSDRSIVKVGKYIGSSLSKEKNLGLVFLVAFILGALVTCAEPSIMALSEQTPIPGWVLVLFISIGVGLFIGLGIFRVIFHRNIRIWLLGFYGLIFALVALVDLANGQFIPLIFDAGGATTGTATVPFILALGAAVAAVRGGSNAKDDSFGLIGIASIGPLLALIILFIFSRGSGQSYHVSPVDIDNLNIGQALGLAFLPEVQNGQLVNYGSMMEVALALIPIIVIFYIYQAFKIHLPQTELRRVGLGFLLAFLGLSVFMAAVEAGMMPLGKYVGSKLGQNEDWVIILVCFALGMVTVLCEPSDHVLTAQIESISDGSIHKFSVLLTLSIGVGIAIGLCAIRSIYNFSILYYLVPGYIIALALSFFCPTLYVAMAFDSGGVASGPITTSFILPLIIGVTLAKNGNDTSEVMGRAFGVIGMVALIPIIAVQVMGIIEERKKAKRLAQISHHVFDPDDSEIIHF